MHCLLWVQRLYHSSFLTKRLRFGVPNCLIYYLCNLNKFSSLRALVILFVKKECWQNPHCKGAVRVYAKSLQSCPTLCNPIDCSPPGSPVHGILQAKLLQRVAMPSSRESSRPGVKPVSPVLTGKFFTTSATWEAPDLSNESLFLLVEIVF